MLRFVLLLLLMAAPAGAQSPTELSGMVGLSIGERDTGIGYGDATATLEVTPRLSFELGLFGRPLTRQHETYVTLSWRTEGGRISAGFPRPAYDIYAVSLLDRMLPQEADRVDQVAATRSRLTRGTFADGEVQVGVLYRADSTWAASAHRVIDSDLAVGSLGGGVRLGGWDVAGALERSSDGESGAKLTAAREFGAVGAQVGAFHRTAPEAGDMIEAGLTWHVGRRLELGALTQITTGDGDERLAALAATVTMPRGQVGLGLLVEDGEPSASIAYGLKF
jgi:hypothetical protein